MKNANATRVAARFVQRHGKGYSDPAYYGLDPNIEPSEVKAIRAYIVQRRQCARAGHPLTISTGYAGPDSGADGAHCACGRKGFHVTLY